jgi:hypothetical protein
VGSEVKPSPEKKDTEVLKENIYTPSSNQEAFSPNKDSTFDNYEMDLEEPKQKKRTKKLSTTKQLLEDSSNKKS